MATKHIVSVGYGYPSETVETLNFYSNQSLLDFDIIIFRPGFYTYSSKDKINEIQHSNKHWESELQIAFDAGKTIIIYLSPPEEVDYKYEGEYYSLNSYESIPFYIPLEYVIPKEGKFIKTTRSSSIIADYWKNFSENSKYQVYFNCAIEDTLLTTKTGNKPVGYILNSEIGSVLFLPLLDYDEDDFNEIDNDTGEEIWTPEALRFGKRLTQVLVNLDTALKKGHSSTPVPTWVTTQKYPIYGEQHILDEIDGIQKQIEKLTEQKEQCSHNLEMLVALRQLLYDTGKSLETAVTEALTIIGIKAHHFQNAQSEFDILFNIDDERFLGEVEGKENSAIDITKLKQLEGNIGEDFDRENIEDYARGILFGNAYRLKPVEERGDYFTQKCLKGAKRTGITLVRTPDLFTVVQYIRQSNDLEYAKACRNAIAQTKGEIVIFPPIPCT